MQYKVCPRCGQRLAPNMPVCGRCFHHLPGRSRGQWLAVCALLVVLLASGLFRLGYATYRAKVVPARAIQGNLQPQDVASLDVPKVRIEWIYNSATYCLARVYNIGDTPLDRVTINAYYRPPKIRSGFYQSGELVRAQDGIAGADAIHPRTVIMPGESSTAYVGCIHGLIEELTVTGIDVKTGKPVDLAFTETVNPL